MSTWFMFLALVSFANANTCSTFYNKHAICSTQAEYGTWIATYENVRNTMSCAVRCDRNSMCLSFVYSEMSRTCNLNSQTRNTSQPTCGNDVIYAEASDSNCKRVHTLSVSSTQQTSTTAATSDPTTASTPSSPQPPSASSSTVTSTAIPTTPPTSASQAPSTSSVPTSSAPTSQSTTTTSSMSTSSAPAMTSTTPSTTSTPTSITATTSAPTESTIAATSTSTPQPTTSTSTPTPLPTTATSTSSAGTTTAVPITMANAPATSQSPTTTDLTAQAFCTDGARYDSVSTACVQECPGAYGTTFQYDPQKRLSVGHCSTGVADAYTIDECRMWCVDISLDFPFFVCKTFMIEGTGQHKSCTLYDCTLSQAITTNPSAYYVESGTDMWHRDCE